jgi:hypothetical protein
MESPDSVKRVIPPSITWIIIIPTPINNQLATALEDRASIFSFFNILSIAMAKLAQQWLILHNES